MSDWKNSSCKKFLDEHMKQYLPDASQLRSEMTAVMSSHEIETGAEQQNSAYEYWKSGQEMRDLITK